MYLRAELLVTVSMCHVHMSILLYCTCHTCVILFPVFIQPLGILVHVYGCACVCGGGGEGGGMVGQMVTSHSKFPHLFIL